MENKCERPEPMIRLSRGTVALLRGVEHKDYFGGNVAGAGAEEADYCLNRDAPTYSMCGGMLTSGRDLLDNEEGPDDPYAARVRADMATFIVR